MLKVDDMDRNNNCRESGFELLRIVAMVFILVVHVDGASLAFPDYREVWTSGDWWRMTFEALAITGVNLFVLISGYFTIRLTARRLVNYIIMCGFYAWGIFAVHCAVDAGYFTWQRLADAAMVYSGTDLWFIRDYLFLMLLAPLLNGGLEALSHRPRRLTGVVVSLLVINCWFGWWQSGAVNPTGYNLMQMVMIYVIGYWMRVCDVARVPAWVSLTAWAVATVSIVGMSRGMEPVRAFAYNQPMVIVASCALFAAFARVRFVSRAVNWVAASSFAVYLIHKDPYVWVSVIRPTVRDMAAEMSGVGFVGGCAAFVVAVFAACVAVDKVRYYLHIRW